MVNFFKLGKFNLFGTRDIGEPRTNWGDNERPLPWFPTVSFCFPWHIEQITKINEQKTILGIEGDKKIQRKR